MSIRGGGERREGISNCKTDKKLVNTPLTAAVSTLCPAVYYAVNVGVFFNPVCPYVSVGHVASCFSFMFCALKLQNITVYF